MADGLLVLVAGISQCIPGCFLVAWREPVDKVNNEVRPQSREFQWTKLKTPRLAPRIMRSSLELAPFATLMESWPPVLSFIIVDRKTSRHSLHACHLDLGSGVWRLVDCSGQSLAVLGQLAVVCIFPF